MTDTPGWASPSSSEPPRDDARPPADAPAAVPGQSAPPQGAPVPPPAWGGPQVPPARPGWGGPPPGPQGPYGPYGQAPYGWGPPPSPKPGIIPLRPLGLGELLDGSVATIRKHWRTALGLSLGIAVLQQAGGIGAELLIGGKTGDFTTVVVALARMPLDLLLGVIASALLTVVVSRAILGQSVTLREAWRDSGPRLLQLLGLSLLTGLITGGVVLLGFAPLIGYEMAGAKSPAIVGLLVIVGLLSLPVGAWLWIQLSLAAPALMLEKQGVITALSRSRRLVRGAWWRIFGINLLSKLISFIVSFVIAIPFTVIGLVVGFGDLQRQAASGGETTVPMTMLIAAAIAGVIAATITVPFSAGIGVLLYVDQRIRREALDIELARAAGLPEYGGTGWSGRPGPDPTRL
ncbi:hypothetical protein [Kitasatospora aureofaciens]|uniref:DUF7544 domain-containing protein n=1 Tax=Kitasatospora aureofaciens TaxID=1894 RepID=UPI001C464991|nr:hypothetical protein [Kitasatospora aureofaciens]MBV6701672.1 hypothetical protein [Kitasatospora aureofaciens]